MTDIEPQTAQRLLRECRDLLAHDLTEWLEDLGAVIAEDALGLANATRDEAKKAEYVGLRVDVQSRWETLTAAFDKQLTKQLRQVRIVEGGAGDVLDASDLQLVDDKQLVESIVIREFIVRVTEACSEETFALDRRVAHLMGRKEEDASDDQLGPHVVCEAFRAGFEAMYTDLAKRTLLLRQVERHLNAELPEIYRAINEILINAGVLPDLKRSYRRGASARAAAAEADNILGTLQRLAEARQVEGAPGGQGGFGGIGGGGELSPADAMAVRTAFFQSLPALQETAVASPGALTNVVRLARDSDAARQVAPLEAITLDIVAMLFDLIFDDDKVPSAVKGLVSRLQLPVLKVAMVDQRFFADRGHPARRFLDSISGISVRWGAAVNEGDPLYMKLSDVVGRIHDNFDEDPDIFGAAVEELARFVNEREEIEAETSRTVAEAVQRRQEEEKPLREQQAAARQAADSSLAPLLATAMPREIEQFLRGHWRGVLQKLALSAGTDSAPYGTAERIAKELVWSTLPKSDPEERRRLVALLPKLLAGLQQGLDHLGVPEDVRRPFLDALVTLHSAAIRAETPVKKKKRGQEPEEVAPAPEVAAPQPEVKHSIENGIQIEEVSLPTNDNPEEEIVLDRTCLRRVKHLVRGDWVEFGDADGRSRRERLTWISPGRSLYLFSDHINHRAMSVTAEALAHWLQTGTIRLVESEAPMFERALEGAIKSLGQ